MVGTYSLPATLYKFLYKTMLRKGWIVPSTILTCVPSAHFARPVGSHISALRCAQFSQYFMGPRDVLRVESLTDLEII